MHNSITNRKTPKTNNQYNNSNLDNQDELEICIIKYQEAIKDNNRFAVNDMYAKICNIYTPSNYSEVWWRKYGYLFEEKDDFEQEYLRIFCRVLKEWLPREARGKSRYGGKGYFQNFFYGSLSHHFTNMVKSMSSNKRNVATRCPICEQWCNTLSTHLREHHADLLWQYLDSCGKNVNDLTTCPFCKTYKSVKNVECEHGDNTCKICFKKANLENIKKHLMSKHSNYLFEKFHDLFPDYPTLSSKPASVYFHDEDNEESSIYDILESNDNFNSLMSLNLSNIQRKIVFKILNGANSVKYDSSLYKCTQQEFQKEFEELKSAMILCGFEG
jgi:hypothetical protein